VGRGRSSRHLIYWVLKTAIPNTGGPPLVRSQLVQFPLVRIFKRLFIRSLVRDLISKSVLVELTVCTTQLCTNKINKGVAFFQRTEIVEAPVKG
jgi:hypothetical protein